MGIVQNDTQKRKLLPGLRHHDRACFVSLEPAPPAWLYGTWKLYRADPSLDFAPGVRMEFGPDGHLQYHIDIAGSDQTVELLYQVEGDLLHTENVIAPHTMTVRFAREGEDVLALDFGGASAWLLREYEDDDDDRRDDDDRTNHNARNN